MSEVPLYPCLGWVSTLFSNWHPGFAECYYMVTLLTKNYLLLGPYAIDMRRAHGGPRKRSFSHEQVFPVVAMSMTENVSPSSKKCPAPRYSPPITVVLHS